VRDINVPNSLNPADIGSLGNPISLQFLWYVLVFYDLVFVQQAKPLKQYPITPLATLGNEDENI
jgi:hypothetical protein